MQAFLDEQASVIGANVVSARRNFDDAVTQLSTLAAKQASSTVASTGATARLKAVRALLRNTHMGAIRHAARMTLTDVPEIGTLTTSTRNLSDPRLVATAHGMAEAAERYTSVFTQSGLPDDFVARLRAAADAVTQGSVERAQAATRVSAATASIPAQESRLRKLLKLLNALVVPRLGTDAGLLRAWRAARAIAHQTEIVPVPASVVSPSPATANRGAAPSEANSTAPVE